MHGLMEINKMTTLRATKNPNLPIAPTQYSERYFNQLTDVMRLYFTQVDTITTALASIGNTSVGGGGKYLAFPHIAASDTADQFADGDDTPTQVVWNSLDECNGFILDPTGYAAPQQSGVYKIDYSLQLVNTDNVSHDVFVWLEVNGGTQVPKSASKFTIPARKSAGVFAFVVAYSSVTFECIAGDAIRLYWATEQAYNPTGPVNGVYIKYIPAQTVPYAHPEAPSSIGSIIFVSNIPT
jgi:hypothetical protein